MGEGKENPIQKDGTGDNGHEMFIQKGETRIQERARELERLKDEKELRMKQLHAALNQLDRGEEVGQFHDKSRKTIFYDEGGFYISSSGRKQHMAVGDILSDYAWGITYKPSQEIPMTVFRMLTKQILVNETRRYIEGLIDRELVLTHKEASGKNSWSLVEKRWDREFPWNNKQYEGVVAEQMARETLARIGAKNQLGFSVSRATSLEDGKYKYDFRIKTVRREHGVVIEGEPPKKPKSKKRGIQFTKLNTASYESERVFNKKVQQLKEVKKKYTDELPVDDIVLVHVPSDEYAYAFSVWLNRGKPHGGPEQFLGKRIKRDLLRQATDGLIEIKRDQAISF